MTNLRFIVPQKIKMLSLILLVIGIASAIFGFINNPVRTWGNFLICNYYFISLAIGASFFLAIQSITQSGWSAMFKRVGEAIVSYLPYAAILIIILVLFGGHSIYKWTNINLVKSDALLQHKSAYLNYPFYVIRSLINLGIWIFLTTMLRRFSLNEDKVGGLVNFEKTEFCINDPRGKPRPPVPRQAAGNLRLEIKCNASYKNDYSYHGMDFRI